MKKILSMLLLFIFIILSVRAECAQNEKVSSKEAERPDIIEITMEILSISQFDIAAGKYNVEFGVIVRYPYIDIPQEMDLDTFQDKILKKADKEQRYFLLKCYRTDEKKSKYLVNENINDSEQMKLYSFLKKAGYYDGMLPFDIVNGKVETDEKRGKAKIERKEIEPDNPTLIYYLINAEITITPDFQEFPFDRQDLSIILASNYLTSVAIFKPIEDYVMLPEQISYNIFNREIKGRLKPKESEAINEAYQLNPEKTSFELKDISRDKEINVKKILNSIGFNTLINPRVILPGWNIEEGNPIFGRDSYMGERFSTFTFPIRIKRNILASLIKTFMPLFIIMLISFLALFVGVSTLSNRLAIVSGMLLACVMAHINSTSSIPPLGNHLNITDKIFIASYVSILINVLFTVLMINQNEKKHDVNVERIHRTAIWFVPAATIIAYIIILTKLI